MYKILLAILLSTSFACAQVQNYKATIQKAPVATMQLVPAIFISGELLKKLDISEGKTVLLKMNSIEKEMRVYWAPGDSAFVGLHKEYRDEFGVMPNEEHTVTISKISSDETTLKPIPINFFIENYTSENQNWIGFAFGAPHGDCDRETGNIIKIVSEKYGIPATAAYGPRFSYRGIWFDVNRPLMKLAKVGGGTIPSRVWNDESFNLYTNYQQNVWQNNEMKQGDRFKLFCSFHGHDLTVKMPNGNRIERPVIEGMGVGFSKNELRRIKKFYDSNKSRYYENPPLLVFGNLPEDRTYYYNEMPMTFFYSGTGTRVYGSLRSDLVEHALHLETPNTMRLDPEVQPKTAQLLNDLYKFVKDSIFVNETTVKPINTIQSNPPAGFGKKAPIASDRFLMGAPEGVGWSAERPQHEVQLDSFSIDIYEVTNFHYASFLNEALAKEMILVSDGFVKSKNDTNRVWFQMKNSAPMSQIYFQDEKFYVVENKDYFPVIYVSWFGAQAYANFYGERLPTEAEWEIAASWDSKHDRKYLYSYKSDQIEETKANFEDSGDAHESFKSTPTTPVGYFKTTSPAGLYDMSGNVFEWCSDWYEYGLFKNEPENGWYNPNGPESGTMKSIRGGAWNHEPWITRTTFRLGVHPNSTLVNVGFRCVK